MMSLLCFVSLMNDVYAQSCKVDLGDKVEAFESEKCFEENNYWVIQSCATKKICKVSDKSKVSRHRYKCPKRTGNPIVACLTVPRKTFNTTKFSVIKMESKNGQPVIANERNGWPFYDYDTTPDSSVSARRILSSNNQQSELVAVGSIKSDSVQVCGADFESVTENFLKSQNENVLEECQF